MDRDMRLIYISSKAITAYCEAHPINWASKDMANGPGNVKTPSPAVALFYKIIAQNEALFTQEDFWNEAKTEWREWLANQEQDVQLGLKARLYRNFYPSCIDTLHAWAILAESGRFAYCILDPIRDAVAKTDITVHSLGGISIGVALYVNSRNSQEWTAYKRTYRGEVKNVIDVILPMDRPRNPGNKRWYQPSDFAPVYAALAMPYTATITQSPSWTSNNYDLGA